MSNKIVYITSNFPFNNSETWSIHEIESLINEGVDIIIIPRSGSGKLLSESSRRFIDKTIAVPFINITIFLFLLKYFFNHVSRILLYVCWIIKRSDSFKDFIKGIVVLPKSLYIASILKEKNISHIHAFSTTSVATMSYIVASELKVGWSVTFHSSWTINRKHKKSILLLSNTANYIRVISQEVEKCLKLFLPKRLHFKIIVIHIGINCQNKTQYPIVKKKTYTIVSVGWLLPHKGIDISLLSIKSLVGMGITNFVWNIYGDGPLKSELEGISHKLEIGNYVKFKGNIDNYALLKIYKDHMIDIFVSNSVHRLGIYEGIPVSIMEAMAYSIPVIATDCGGTKELVDDLSGILITQKEPEATASSIVKLMSDHKFYMEMCNNGRNKVLQHFNSTLIAKQLKQLFFASI